MAITHTQSKGATASGTSIAISFNSTPAVGSLIVVSIASYSADMDTGTLADNQGNTYTPRRSLVIETGSEIYIYTAVASTSSGTFTITATPFDGGDLCMSISEFSGQHATFYDQQNQGTGSSTTPSSGNVTPGEDNELLFANLSHTNTNRTLTEEGGWSLAYENEGGSTTMPLSTIYKIQTTATTEDADWTIGTGSVAWGANIITCKAAASGGTNITVSESTQAQVSDAATIRAYYPIVPAESTQNQLSDAVIAKSIYTVTPAEATQSQTSDDAAIKSIYRVTPAEAAQAQTSDAAGIIAVYPLAPAEATQAQASDAAILKAVYLLTPAEATQAQTSDAATLGQFTPIAPAESTQAQTSDAVTLTPIYVIAPAEATQAQASDAVVLTPIYVIAPAEASQAQVSDAAPITFNAPGAATNITPAEASQAQTSDAATITPIYILTPAEAAQSQTSDAAVISFSAPTYNITPAESYQAQISDTVSLAAIHLLAAGEALQTQASDAAILSLFGVVGHGERVLHEMDVRSNSVFVTRPTHDLATREDLEVDDGN